MNWRLLLLLNCPLGLHLTPSELEKLSAPDLESFDPKAVEAIVENPKGKSYLRAHEDWREISRAILSLSQEHGVRWSYPGCPDYPVSWLQLSCRPAIFSYMGEPVWNFPTSFISIVGSRTPKPDTILWMQRELSAYFDKRAVCTVSGGARGVDQWVHRLSMDCNLPSVCIFPSGLLNPYPFEAQPLWQRILSRGGALISTFDLHQPVHKRLFAVRNRWIAGLSKATFVVEGNRRSGSLLTASLALEEGRTICTLPVFPFSEQGLGNLDLLNEGALMIRDHRDLLALHDRELGPALTDRA